MFVRNSKSLYCGSASLALLVAGLFWNGSAAAQQVAANSASAGEVETVVITGTSFDPDTAPAKASLDTTEPETIISKSYIQNSVAATGSYTTILAIAPSMTGSDLNGPGLSDGGVKNTLRGLPDGMYNITWDGIPFGDTNGPSHHSESYFPASTIGNIVVDRGPGNAGNMGPATYGGSINLFSQVLTSDRHLLAEVTGGSFGTSEADINVQTGDFDVAGFNNRVMLNYQDTNTGGYLTLNSSAAQNYTIKTQTDLATGWTLTAFANFSGLFQQLEDNAGTTAAQLVAYGKNFALQNTNPNAGTYAPYNHVHKKTDMDYVRLQGDLGFGIKLDNTAYTYAYVNKTESTVSVLQTASDIAAGITENNVGSPTVTNGSVVNGKVFPNDIPGYTKQNAYRNWGDILRLSDDYDFGWLTGQVRTGVWWEHSSSQRARSDYDATQCNASSAGCDPWHTQFYADSRLNTGQKTIGSAQIPGNTNFYEYYEHSGWDQYQPFVEVDLHPFTEDLTITPGFKYVWWNHYVAAPLEQKTKPVVAVNNQFTTTQDLPFATLNYKLQPSWSVYAQFAKGIYIPDISVFEQKVPTGVFPKAETTTNYQFGTVYYADNWTFDGDIYYIGVNNNYVSGACTPTGAFAGPTGETCFVNTGAATYKGIEAEGTYAFDGILQGLAFFANGSLNNSKSGGFWVKQAPMWTSASGLFYKMDNWNLSVIDKVVGQQYSDNTNTTFYKLGAYNQMDFKGGYSFSNYEFSLGLFNVLNSRSLAAVTINDATPAAGNVAGMPAATGVNDYTHRQNSLDQYSYQAGRSVQFTVRARF